MKTPLTKWLAFLAIVLLIINGYLAYRLWKKPQRKERNANRGDWIVNQLQLDEKQQAEHKKLKEAHFNDLKPLFDSITSARTSLYALIKENDPNDSLVTYYSGLIGEKHKEVAAKTFVHFKQVRAICNPQQQVKLDSVVQKIVQNMGGKKGRSGGSRN